MNSISTFVGTQGPQEDVQVSYIDGFVLFFCHGKELGARPQPFIRVLSAAGLSCRYLFEPSGLGAHSSVRPHQAFCAARQRVNIVVYRHARRHMLTHKIKSPKG